MSQFHQPPQFNSCIAHSPPKIIAPKSSIGHAAVPRVYVKDPKDLIHIIALKNNNGGCIRKKVLDKAAELFAARAAIHACQRTLRLRNDSNHTVSIRPVMPGIEVRQPIRNA